jgi:hypothetical protein
MEDQPEKQDLRLLLEPAALVQHKETKRVIRVRRVAPQAL